MTQNLPNWFSKKYDDTVTERAQQRVRRLGGTVAGGGTFIGDSVYFPRIGAVEMYDSPRMAALALANADMDMIQVQAKPKFVAMGIWDPDKTKLSISTATEYGRAAGNAGLRAEDRIIRNVLADAAANGVANATNGNIEQITTIGDYNTVADLDTIVQALSVLGTNEMFEDEDVTVALPFKLKINTSLDPYMAKNDVKGNRPWDDVNWRTYERFPGNSPTGTGALADGATGVDFYVYARNAIVSAANNEMTKIEERIGAALTDMIGNWFQAGAAVKEPKGIVRIKSKLDFNIARKAIPIIEE